MITSRNWHAIVLLAGIGVLVSLSAHGQSPTRPEGPGVASVASRSGWENSLQVKGLTLPFRKSLLASLQPGRILDLPVVEGQHVKEGDLVAQLDASVQVPRTEAARIDAESNLKVDLAAVQIEHARYAWDRLEGIERSAASAYEIHEARMNLDTAVLNHAIAKTQREQAIENYRMQKELLKQHELRAPFSGYVTSRLKEVGETVEELEGVIELCQLDTLLVVLDCPLAIRGAVRVGDRVVVVPRDPQWSPKTGEVIFANPVADAGSQTLKTKLIVPNADLDWPGGLIVTVDFSTRRPGEEAVPAACEAAAGSQPASTTGLRSEGAVHTEGTRCQTR